MKLRIRENLIWFQSTAEKFQQNFSGWKYCGLLHKLSRWLLLHLSSYGEFKARGRFSSRGKFYVRGEQITSKLRSKRNRQHLIMRVLWHCYKNVYRNEIISPAEWNTQNPSSETCQGFSNIVQVMGIHRADEISGLTYNTSDSYALDY